MSKPLSVDEVLSLSKAPPSYLQKSKIASAFFLDQSAPGFSKPPPKKLLSSTPTEIMKPAQINKETYDSLREFEKTYQTFRDLNELSNLGVEKKVEKEKEKEENEIDGENKNQKQIKIKEKEEEVTVGFQGIGYKADKTDDNKINDMRNNKRKKPIQKRGGRGSIKDKEKEKRMKGQSSHSSWKSETHMNLRQQFD